MGDHVEGAIDRADFGDNSRQPGRMQSRHLQDVVERRVREMSPDRGPAGPRESYMDRDLSLGTVQFAKSSQELRPTTTPSRGLPKRPKGHPSS